MEEISDSTEKSVHEEVMLPGFRFHPTDEELVGFYLKKKIQQRPLAIELIKQLDIYKHDPWDLPKLASTAGEKEWYFYCPRDRKYRNSARPNRVTGAGFWKATGTDRPIYSSDGNKCIGLKKSLVFYKGRAAKGVKTDWMMHEFRLPSLPDNSKRAPSDKTFLVNDSWAICRIFKKTNSAAQRALSHSWVSHLQEPNASLNSFSSETRTTSSSSPVQFCNPRNDTIQDSSLNSTSFSPVDFSSLYKAYHNIPITNMSSPDFFPTLMFPPLESSPGPYHGPEKCETMDDIAPNPTMLLSMSSILGDSNFGCQKSLNHEVQHGNTINGFELGFPYHHDSNHAFQGNGFGNISTGFDHHQTPDQDQDHQWESVRSSLGFPTLSLPNLPLNTSMADPWKPSLLWDTSPCPSANSPTTRCFN